MDSDQTAPASTAKSPIRGTQAGSRPGRTHRHSVRTPHRYPVEHAGARDELWVRHGLVGAGSSRGSRLTCGNGSTKCCTRNRGAVASGTSVGGIVTLGSSVAELLNGQPHTSLSRLSILTAACRSVMPSVVHCTDPYANSRPEVSPQPPRQREHQTRRFKSAAQLQRFASVQRRGAESLPRRSSSPAVGSPPRTPHTDVRRIGCGDVRLLNKRKASTARGQARVARNKLTVRSATPRPRPART